MSIDSPRLREIATVVAVGVGKRIKKPELVEIAGDPDQVYMVADFRSLTLSRNGSTLRHLRYNFNSQIVLKNFLN